MIDVLTDGLMLALLFSLGLLIMGYKMKSPPIIFISSLGWIISALQIYQQTEEILPSILLMMLSCSQFFILKRDN